MCWIKAERNTSTAKSASGLVMHIEGAMRKVWGDKGKIEQRVIIEWTMISRKYTRLRIQHLAFITVLIFPSKVGLLLTQCCIQAMHPLVSTILVPSSLPLFIFVICWPPGSCTTSTEVLGLYPPSNSATTEVDFCVPVYNPTNQHLHFFLFFFLILLIWLCWVLVAACRV